MQANQLTSASVQQVLNGNFDRKWLHMKATSELATSMQSVTQFYQNAMNVAVTIAHMIDWAWHQEVKDMPKWAGRKPQEFSSRVRKSSWQTEAMADLANNFKHAHRDKPNFLVTHLLLLRSEASISSYERETKIIQWVGESAWEFIPMLTTTQGISPYSAVVADALAWWDKFEPDNFE